MPKKPQYPTTREKNLKGVVRTSLDSPNPTPAQLARKDKNTARVKAMGLPTIAHLPVVEDESQVRPRTSEEIARRCVATTFCAVRSEASDLQLIEKLVKDYEAAPFFSPLETKFIHDPNPPKQDRTEYSWRYECCHVSLWALGHLDELKPPNVICDVLSNTKKMRSITPKEFVSKAVSRPSAEIRDMADLYDRFH